MDFSFSAEQQLLKKEIQQFLTRECPKKVIREIEASGSGYSPRIWEQMAELGWLGLAVPEAYGGAGGNLIDLAILFEEIGRAVLPSPLFATIMYGALPLAEWGTEDQKREIFPELIRGKLILTMALAEPEADRADFFTTRATHSAGKTEIQGIKVFVPYAHAADLLFVAARDGDGITLFPVHKGAGGLKITQLKAVGADRLCEVRLDRVSLSPADILGPRGKGLPVMESTLRKATAIHCVQTVGVMQQALAMTAEYTSKRVQFGRPIGSFQAVQHRLADMLIDTEGARWLSYRAVSLLSKGRQADREVAIAKAWASEACQRVAYAAQHLHGGIGMDLDYDLHFYFRWAKAMDLNLGVAAHHLASIEPVFYG